jgi:hypothetical protein
MGWKPQLILQGIETLNCQDLIWSLEGPKKWWSIFHPELAQHECQVLGSLGCLIHMNWFVGSILPNNDAVVRWFAVYTSHCERWRGPHFMMKSPFCNVKSLFSWSWQLFRDPSPINCPNYIIDLEHSQCYNYAISCNFLFVLVFHLRIKHFFVQKCGIPPNR